MTIARTEVHAKLKPAMEAAGLDHVLYGTVFKKENVEVYISEFDATKYSLSSQSFDGPEGNHHTKSIRKIGFVTKHLDTTYAELVKALVEEAHTLVKNTNRNKPRQPGRNNGAIYDKTNQKNRPQAPAKKPHYTKPDADRRSDRQGA